MDRYESFDELRNSRSRRNTRHLRQQAPKEVTDYRDAKLPGFVLRARPTGIHSSGCKCRLDAGSGGSRRRSCAERCAKRRVVAKRKDLPYHPGARSDVWRKLKLEKQQEFVVGGYRPDARSVDALLVGYYDQKYLYGVGKIRAGLTPHLRASCSIV